VPYGCSLEHLLAILRERTPTEADALAEHRRRVEHGLLSVGLKVHCLGAGKEFASLVKRLGGNSRVLQINMYKHARASLCLVLPPVGNARAATALLECVASYTGCSLLGNRSVQIQVCSPGRLDPRRSALLAIGFYLGSDTLRRYVLGDFETTVSNDVRYGRGQRLVIYDAAGEFDRGFEWWSRSRNGLGRVIRRHLPFENGRTDLLAGSASKLDIENINLLATLLVHAQVKGYWAALGQQFEGEMHALLDRHLLAGLADAPWVKSGDPERYGDRRFMSALQELVAYAFDESARLSKKSKARSSRSRQQAGLESHGILHEMQSMLQEYRIEIVRQSGLDGKGRRT
jgi:hypothetical protein